MFAEVHDNIPMEKNKKQHTKQLENIWWMEATIIYLL